MKRISLIVNIVLIVAVVALYVLYFTDSGKKTIPLVDPETMVNLPAGSIVYVQIDSLINELDLFHELRSDLEVKAKAVDDDLSKKERAFERDAIDFNEKYQTGRLTSSQAQTQSAQLDNRQRELQQYSQQKQMELAEEQQVMLNNILYEIQTYLTAYNLEHNFSLIFSTSGNPGSIIIGNAALDITKAVITGLNAQYAAQNSRRR